MATPDPSSRYVKNRRINRLNGICKLMVEYNVTISDLEKHFNEEYETPDAILMRKRTRQNQGPIRRERAKNAVATRWSKYDALRQSNVVAREAAMQRVANLQKPNFGIEDEKIEGVTIQDPVLDLAREPIQPPESQVKDERLTNPMLDVSAEPVVPEDEVAAKLDPKPRRKRG